MSDDMFSVGSRGLWFVAPEDYACLRNEQSLDHLVFGADPAIDGSARDGHRHTAFAIG